MSQRKIPKFIKIVVGSVLGLSLLAGAGGAGVYFVYAKTLPSNEQIVQWSSAQATRIYDRNGTLLYEVFDEEKRINLTSDQIAQTLKEATIAIEDHRFYHHNGIDPIGIARAFHANAKANSAVQGGSTISQQLAKNMYLSSNKTLDRKVRQALIGLKIEQNFTKDEILTMYLNQVNYGGNAYGAEAAANMYFRKSAKDLTLSESAMLAALPKAPGVLSPYKENHDQLIARRNTILDKMAEQKFITVEQAEASKKENIVIQPRQEKIEASHFVMYVKQKLIEKYGEEVVEKGGLQVTTSLDLTKQHAAEKVLTEAIPNLHKLSASNASLIAINPKNGHIEAMVGSLNYFNDKLGGKVNVTTSHRPPGSAFKPIVYAAGFERGWSPGSTLFDVETDFEETQPGQKSTKTYIPRNYDLKYHGPVSIREALANSYNVPAVKMMALVGKEDTIKTAQQLGISTLNDTAKYGLSLVLGGGDVRLLDLAGAYGSFANAGSYVEPTAIVQVKRGEEVLYEHKAEPRPVFRPEVAYEVSSILSDSKAREPVFGTRTPLNIPGYTVAVKTGTTQDYRDAWTVGYTPSLVVGVWVGNNDFSPMKSGSAGAMAAAPLWNKFMSQALAAKPDEPFAMPAGMETVALDTITGKLPTPGTRQTRQDIVAAWQKQQSDTQQLASYQIIGCDGSVREVRQAYTVHSEKPTEPKWENPVLQWARAHGYPTGRIGNVQETCAPPVELANTEPTILEEETPEPTPKPQAEQKKETVVETPTQEEEKESPRDRRKKNDDE